jgi:hypothetical protein
VSTCQMTRYGVAVHDAPADRRYTIGCVHEHITTAMICSSCADQIVPHKDWWCAYCEDGPDPHICPVDPQWSPL